MRKGTADQIEAGDLRLEKSNAIAKCSEAGCTLNGNPAWCVHHDPHPTRVTVKTQPGVGTKPKSLTLALTDEGIWVPRRPTAVSQLGDFLSRFSESEEELLEYTALAATDMLNSGDVPPYPDYLKWVTAAVRQTGHSLGLRGAWHVPYKKTYPANMTYLHGMTTAKTLYYLRQRAEHLPPSYEAWNPDHIICKPTMVSEEAKGGWYCGEDGKLLVRYATQQLAPEGPTLLNEELSEGALEAEDSPSGLERQGHMWMAAYLVGQDGLDASTLQTALGRLHQFPESFGKTLATHLSYGLKAPLCDSERCARIVEAIAAADPNTSGPTAALRSQHPELYATYRQDVL